MNSYLVLECQKDYSESPFVYRGLVLRKDGKKKDEIFFCSMVDSDAINKYYRPGDIVEAELLKFNYFPDREPDYSDFIVNKIKLVNKLSWKKLK